MWRHHFPAVFGGRLPLSTELPPRQPSEPEGDADELLPLVAVPDLVGMTSTDARRLARAARLSVTVEERHSSQGLWGRVLAQDPAPGVSNTPDGMLTLTVGTRPRVPVPDVRGRDEDEALSILREAGLGTARRAIRSSDRVPEGCIVRTRPRHGAEVATGSRISYVVAASPRQAGRGSGKRSRRATRAARLADGSFLLADKGLDRPSR